MVIVGLAFLFDQFPAGNSRYWSQRYLGRSLISSFRFLLETSIIYTTFILYTKVSHKNLLKILSLVGLTSATYALANYLSNGYLNSILFPSSRLELSYRFLGMNGEPRAFGQSMAVLSLIFLVDYMHSKKNRSLTIFLLTSIFVGLSLSATSIITLSFSAIAVSLANLGLKYIKRISRLLVTISLVSFLFFYMYTNVLPRSESQVRLIQQLTQKVQLVVGINSENISEYANKSDDVLPIFSRLEVFDRAAMNFMADNPISLLTGVGPNTVSIPASDYTDTYNKLIFGDMINAVPHSGFINAFTWGGLIGLAILSRFYLRLFRLTVQNPYSRSLFIVSIVVFFLIDPASQWILYGYIASISLTPEKGSFTNNDFYKKDLLFS
jgi:hypothetical protein